MLKNKIKMGLGLFIEQTGTGLNYRLPDNKTITLKEVKASSEYLDKYMDPGKVNIITDSPFN